MDNTKCGECTVQTMYIYCTCTVVSVHSCAVSCHPMPPDTTCATYWFSNGCSTCWNQERVGGNSLSLAHPNKVCMLSLSLVNEVLNQLEQGHPGLNCCFMHSKVVAATLLYSWSQSDGIFFRVYTHFLDTGSRHFHNAFDRTINTEHNTF